MVISGTVMILLTLVGSYLMWKKRLFERKWIMRFFVLSVLLPQVANQAGWFTAEMGRQPWVVYGLLRTSDALSRKVTANQIVFSLILFAVVYLLLFLLFIYLLNKKIQHGPVIDEHKESYDESGKRNTPIFRRAK
jgi:cytochrome d ubiquinol oxidase subunit I